MKNNSSTQIKPSTKPAFNTSLIMIGENIRKCREALRMSQTELANEVGTSCATISKYELGQREMGVEKLTEIASALGCQPAVLFNESTQPTKIESSMNDVLMGRIKVLPVTEQEKVLSMIDLLLTGAERIYATEK